MYDEERNVITVILFVLIVAVILRTISDIRRPIDDLC